MDSERDARTLNTHAVKSVQAQAVVEPAQFCVSMQTYGQIPALNRDFSVAQYSGFG